jgi:hypothetical protein
MGMDVMGIKNEEAYFRASVWSWRPIQVILDFINEKHELGIDMSSFGYNDGGGIKDPRVCEIIADILEGDYIAALKSDDVDRIYLNLGSWSTAGGYSIKKEDYPEGEFPLFSINGYVTPKGNLVYSTHSIEREHLLEFCKFLRNCGGFEIW